MKTIVSIMLIVTVFLAFNPRICANADLQVVNAPVFQKGMCFVTWDGDRFMSRYSDESLAKMKEIRVEWVAIVVTWYQEEYDSKKIFPAANTPRDRSIIHVINKAHDIGLKVMLKPHIDLVNQEDTLWRADIGFVKDSDWKKWFKYYNRFILHYARMAEKTGVEIFCIGTELTFAATKKPDVWINLIIPSVRKAYSGPITYAANWHEEYENIKFWEYVDYAGVDAYFPLCAEERPSFEEIKSAWQKWLIRIEEWQNTINKPVIFTEAGYCSVQGAAKRPWEVGMKGTVDLGLQADCYRALLEVFWEKPWFYGVYWWKWNINARSGGKTHRRFTPQNKPAQDVLAGWYKNKANPAKANDLENIELVRYTY